MNTIINDNDWIKFFPYNKPRKQQANVINKVLNEFKSDKKYAIVDCGTGVGKSAIAITISNYIKNSSEYINTFTKGSYILTTQKILQDQYRKDFQKSEGLVSLYSSSNYQCDIDKKASCKDIQTALRSNSLPKKYNNCSYNCVYKKTKKEFIDNDLGITNFSYFLTEKNYSQKIPHKQVLIIDEAHNLESELSRFIEISISSYFSEKILKLKVPKDLNTQFKTFNWIKNVYYHEVVKKTEFIKGQLEKFGISSSKLEEFKKITNRYDMLVSHQKKILQFITIYDKDNWVFDVVKTDKSYSKYSFKPIEISAYAKEYLLNFADYVIFMSATILSHEGFALTLGLPHDKIISVKEDSHTLYGFFDKKERECFCLLLSVSGVGASTARMMLSSLSPGEIISAIRSDSVQIIQSIKGIGAKTAQRVILELKDKVMMLDESDNEHFTFGNESTEAASALEVLGYSQKQTGKILTQIVSDNPGINVETLIKKALNKL